MEHLHNISAAAYVLLLEKYDWIFRALDRKVTADNEEVDTAPDSADEGEQNRRKKHPAEKLKEELDGYLKELPVLGFNSGKYDLNLMKRYLYAELQRVDPLQFIVKRTSTYMAMKTEMLKFLDITNYLAPGYSYSKFLKAYDVEEQKGFFPYEWVDSLDKLGATELPPHDAFFSKLKNANITQEQYSFCQEIWNSKNMQTMRDFVTWYNNLDVVPFLSDIANMFAFYQDRGMDMFKCAISVPGLSLRYLFLTVR